MKNGHGNDAQAVRSTAATVESVFDIMVDMAKVWQWQFHLTISADCPHYHLLVFAYDIIDPVLTLVHLYEVYLRLQTSLPRRILLC